MKALENKNKLQSERTGTQTQGWNKWSRNKQTNNMKNQWNKKLALWETQQDWQDSS